MGEPSREGMGVLCSNGGLVPGTVISSQSSIEEELGMSLASSDASLFKPVWRSSTVLRPSMPSAGGSGGDTTISQSITTNGVEDGVSTGRETISSRSITIGSEAT